MVVFMNKLSRAKEAPGYVFTCPLCRVEVLARADRALHDGDSFACSGCGGKFDVVRVLSERFFEVSARMEAARGNPGSDSGPR